MASRTSQPSPKIAIIGAGPSGLTLASLLHSSLNITLFDLRSRPTAASLQTPSGSLDLHAESGLLALEKCNLTPQFRALSSDCSEEMMVASKDGVVRFKDDGEGSDRPEISRNALSSLLLSSVPSQLIKWETKVLSVTTSSTAETKWRVTYQSEGGKEQREEFDLVIGADGAWSKTRLAIEDAKKPFYSGISCITLTIPHLSTTYPDLGGVVGNGTFTVLGDGKGLISQRGSMDSARMYLMISAEEEAYLKETGLEGLSGKELKGKLLEEESLFSSWSKELKALITAGCDSEKEKVEARPLYMLPSGNTWKHTPGLTLVGDAAHLMTPFAGEGVNCAMLDAAELAQAVLGQVTGEAKWEDGLDEAVQGFEKQMWERSQEIAQGTYDNLKMMFEDEKAPEAFVKFFESMGPPPEE